MDHTSTPKMQEAIRANDPNNYSTLEVAVGAPDYDKEVVHPPHYPYSQDQQYYQQQQVQGSENEPSTWDGRPASTTQHEPNAAGHERRICGIKRKTFFIIAWVVTLIIAVAIGVGAGLGATMRSRNGDGSSQSQGAAAATTSTSKTDLSAVTGTPTISQSKTSGVSDIPTSTPATKDNNNRPGTSTSPSTPSTPETSPAPPPTTTTPPPQTTTTLTLPTTSTKTPQIGGPGGRCQNQWGSDCICLDQGICVNKWKGTPYTGYEGNWPCPDDPDNIMACVVKPCLGQDKTGQTQCLWREGCSRLLDTAGGGTGAPICPGDGDFVCCAHPW